MNKTKRNKGFTLAETLIVVAIITILSGVSFIAVQNHMRSLAQLERDGIAKEIFVAAQNHLTMAEHEGYLGLSDYGKLEDEKDGIYYFVGNGAAFSGDTLLKVMLPFGAVDETVRLGGSYIIRYQRDTGRVLDVFFSWPNQRFPHTFGDEDVISTLMKDYAGEGNTERRNYTGGSVIGWYGGEAAQTLPEMKLAAPSIEVTNAEKLTVTVKDQNTDVATASASLQLILTGETSRKSAVIPLKNISSNTSTVYPEGVVKENTTDHSYTIVLDDITKSGMHFAELFEGFVPGENITVQAIAYSNDARSNIAYSGEKKTNSLFADLTKETSIVGTETISKGTAVISNIRHLENLDVGISEADYTELNITNAKQTTDLDWEDFKAKIEIEHIIIYEKGATPDTLDSGKTKPDCYMPVSPENPLAYDGANHRISNILVDINQNAGIFGDMVTGSSISDLLVYKASITASSGAAGGLIGSMTGTTVTRCAANGTVSAGGAAGGLIGFASSGEVTACYSAGHTSDGSYEKRIEAEDSNNKPYGYDVTGATAGGLIGDAGSTAIENSYSTCSATGTTVGGLIGSGSGAVTSCYATGLVKGTGEKPMEGAFAGSFGGNIVYDETKNIVSYYYQIINERQGADGTISYLPPVGNDKNSAAVKALDETAYSYNQFVGSPSDWQDTVPNDDSLVTYYQGTYPLRTVSQLGATVSEEDHFINTHYGDWPAPEIFVINTGTSSESSGNGNGETAGG